MAMYLDFSFFIEIDNENNTLIKPIDLMHYNYDPDFN